MCTVFLCLAKWLHNLFFCEVAVKICLYQINATKGWKEQKKPHWVYPRSVESIVRQEVAQDGKE